MTIFDWYKWFREEGNGVFLSVAKAIVIKDGSRVFMKPKKLRKSRTSHDE